MATAHSTLDLSPHIRALLASVRLRIRAYVWLEGLSIACIWLGLTFWALLACDYLPVLVGASELSLPTRATLLAATAGGLGLILYYWIGRRIMAPLSDRSMAMLLERKYRRFQDSLVTAVELSSGPAHASDFSRDLLEYTADQAAATAPLVRPGALFNYRPLALRVALGAALLGSVALFGAWRGPTLLLAAERLYLLRDVDWPRSAHLEVEGVELQHALAAGETTPRTTLLPFENGVLKVAKGSQLTLRLKAASAPAAAVTPKQCTIHYRFTQPLEQGGKSRGSALATNHRDVAGYRHFWYDGKPFKGLTSSLEFDVLAYDHRVRNLRLEVVDSPAIVETKLDLVYPAYLVDEATSNFLPVQGQDYLPAGTHIPQGTQVTLKFRANKPLRRAEIRNVEAGAAPVILEFDAQRADPAAFDYRIERLPGDVSLEISLTDADNVSTERPHKIMLTMVEDKPPQIEVRLKGIGAAVTPDVLLPLRGKLSDDYALAKQWIEIAHPEDAPPVIFALAPPQSGVVEQQIDFREQRSLPGGLHLRPKSKLAIVVAAQDKFNLQGAAHTAHGDKVQLDVVTPDELLAQLEVRELALRRRFEMILEELHQMHDSLQRVRAGMAPPVAGKPADPEDRKDVESDDQSLTPEQRRRRTAELQLFRVQRAMQQSLKSAQETLGIADGFSDIREELIHNRLDTQERKQRLQEMIADPLRRICQQEFPELDRKMAAVAEFLARLDGADATPAQARLADPMLERASNTIAELEAVLAKMLDLETYNEVVDIVRDLLKDQENLLDRTKQERRRQAIEDLK